MNIRITIGENKKVHGLRYWTDTFKVRSSIKFVRMYDNEEQIGQVGIDEDDWIVFLAVNPDYRQQGLGTKLVKEAERFIKDRGGNKARLRPQLDNQEQLIKWYEDLGYRLVEKLEDGNVVLEKDL